MKVRNPPAACWLLSTACLISLRSAQAQDMVPTCPPTTAVMPYTGAGDPAAGSPFADNLIETLTEDAWYTYAMGAVVLTHCLIDAQPAPDNSGHMILNFGTQDPFPSCARAHLIEDRKQLWYNLTQEGQRFCPMWISANAPPALSFGSILGRTECPPLAPGVTPPIPSQFRMPFREYGVNETASFPLGAAFVLDDYRFILRMSPHFIVHFCAREVTPVNTKQGPGYQMVAGKIGFNVACVLMMRVGYTLVFTEPAFTTTLRSVTCPADFTRNYTIPDFYKPTPTPSATASATPTGTASASDTATATASPSSSCSGTSSAAPTHSRAPALAGTVLELAVTLPGVTLAQVAAADVLAALRADIASLAAVNLTDVSIPLMELRQLLLPAPSQSSLPLPSAPDGNGTTFNDTAPIAPMAGNPFITGVSVVINIFVAAPPGAQWSLAVQAAVRADAQALASRLVAALSADLVRLTGRSGLPLTEAALVSSGALVAPGGAGGNGTAGASPLLAAYADAASVLLLAGVPSPSPAPVVPAATPLPIGAIAGGGARCALLLVAVLGTVYRRRIADRMGWSQRAKLRKRMQGLRSRSVQLALKRLSYITVDPKPGERAKAAAAAAAASAVYRDADGRVIRNPMAGNPLQAAGLGADWKPTAAALAASSAPAVPSADGGRGGSGSAKEAEQQQAQQGAKEPGDGGKHSPLAPRGSTAGVADSKAGPILGAAGAGAGSKRATLQLLEGVAPVSLSDDPSAFSFAGPVSLSSAVRFSGPGLPGSALGGGSGGDGSGGNGGDSSPFSKRGSSFRGGQPPGLAAAAADMRRRWMHGGEGEEEGRGVAASAARAVQGAQHAAAARDSRLAFGPTAAKKGLLVKGGAKSARRPVSQRMRGVVPSGATAALESALSAANSASAAVVEGRNEGGDGGMEAAEGAPAGDAGGMSSADPVDSSAAPSAAASRCAAVSMGRDEAASHAPAERAADKGGEGEGEGVDEPGDGDKPTVLDVAAAAFLSLPAARRSLYVGAGAATASSTPSNRPSMHASATAAFYANSPAGAAAGAAAGSASAVLPVTEAAFESAPAPGPALSGRAARVSLAVMGRGARMSMAPTAGGLLPGYGVLPVAAGGHAGQPGPLAGAAMLGPSQDTDDDDGEAW